MIDTIDVIEKLIENMIKNVKKQTLCAFVIKINKFNDIIDVDFDLNIIETNANLEKRDDFIIIFEFIVIVFF